MSFLWNMHIYLSFICAEKVSKHCLPFVIQPSGDPGLSPLLQEWHWWFGTVLCLSELLLCWNSRAMLNRPVIEVLFQLACKAGVVSYENCGIIVPWRITSSIQEKWLKVSYWYVCWLISRQAKLQHLNFSFVKYRLNQFLIEKEKQNIVFPNSVSQLRKQLILHSFYC